MPLFPQFWPGSVRTCILSFLPIAFPRMNGSCYLSFILLCVCKNFSAPRFREGTFLFPPMMLPADTFLIGIFLAGFLRSEPLPSSLDTVPSHPLFQFGFTCACTFPSSFCLLSLHEKALLLLFFFDIFFSSFF